MSRPNIYPEYQFSLFRWSTICYMYSLSYMLHHLRRLIQISCWCILPIQYELILIIVRFNVFLWQWMANLEFDLQIHNIVEQHNTFFIFCIKVRLIFTLNTPFPPILDIYRSRIPLLLLLWTQNCFICLLSLSPHSDEKDGQYTTCETRSSPTF